MRITRASHGIAQIISCEVRIALALLFAHQKYTHPPLLRSVLNSKWIKVTRFVILRLSYPVSGIWQQNNLNNYWDKMEKMWKNPADITVSLKIDAENRTNLENWQKYQKLIPTL